jgi:hypothetical protein
MSGVGGQLLHDPGKAISNIFDAAWDVYKAAGKGVVNSATKHLLPNEAKKMVHDQTTKLVAMGPELRAQLKKLSNPNMPFSIGALLIVLAKAVEAWNLRNRRGVAGHVKVGGTSQAKHRAGEAELKSGRPKYRRRKSLMPKKMVPVQVLATASALQLVLKVLLTRTSIWPARSRSNGRVSTAPIWGLMTKAT